MGFVVVCVLLTSLGYIHNHVIRTGDFDALLTFFTTISAVSFFTYLEKKENKYLYYIYLFAALGVLTKSIAALLFFPALFVYAFLQKEVFLILKNKHFYFGLLGFLVLLIGFYLLRESKNPGFIAAVYENELGGRFLNSQEGNAGPFWYYLNNMKEYLYGHWLWMVPFGVLVGLFSKNARWSKLAVFTSLCAGFFFLVISYGKTKLQWYDAPLYPFMAILVGLFLGSIIDFIQSFEKRFIFLRYGLVSAVILFWIFLEPIKPIVHRTYKPQEEFWDIEYYSLSYFLREGIRGKRDFSNQKLLYEGYNAHVLFYVNGLNNLGQKFDFVQVEDIQPNDEIVVYQDNMKEEIEKNFTFEKLLTQNKIEILRIDGRKNDDQN